MATRSNKAKGRRISSPATGFAQLSPEDPQLVEIAPGLRVRSPQQLEVEDRDLGLDATVDVEWSKKRGQLVVTRVELRGRADHPISAVALRQFKLTTLIAAAMQMRAWVKRPSGEWDPVDGAERLDFEEEPQYVARIYRMASASGFTPSKAVAEALDIAESTAAQKVWLCRKLGLLPKTTQRKAKA